MLARRRHGREVCPSRLGPGRIRSQETKDHPSPGVHRRYHFLPRRWIPLASGFPPAPKILFSIGIDHIFPNGDGAFTYSQRLGFSDHVSTLPLGCVIFTAPPPYAYPIAGLTGTLRATVERQFCATRAKLLRRDFLRTVLRCCVYSWWFMIRSR